MPQRVKEGVGVYEIGQRQRREDPQGLGGGRAGFLQISPHRLVPAGQGVEQLPRQQEGGGHRPLHGAGGRYGEPLLPHGHERLAEDVHEGVERASDRDAEGAPEDVRSQIAGSRRGDAQAAEDQEDPGPLGRDHSAGQEETGLDGGPDGHGGVDDGEDGGTGQGGARVVQHLGEDVQTLDGAAFSQQSGGGGGARRRAPARGAAETQSDRGGAEVVEEHVQLTPEVG
mmetsp:Transcript_7700/g.16716  ORF Transcript_7700/g.16716 Transcript_7700/m.16716 type:complete len:227 (+) Transcript_7700:414-1094(+)